MIIKSFEINKIKDYENKITLIYGKNEELKKFFKKYNKKNSDYFIYDENEILNNSEQFIENLLSRSLFEDHKTILVKRTTDKIFKIIEEINEKNLENISIILDSKI